MRNNLKKAVYLVVSAAMALACSLTNPANTPTAPATQAGAPTSGAPTSAPPTNSSAQPVPSKLKHIIVIMQENRSFDHYFGTYPGADGIPMQNGVPTVCVNDPATGKCDKPYHDPNDVNYGGPHAQQSATQDIDGGKMDGSSRRC